MKKELAFSITKKDLDIQTFCSGGPGGQHQNKTESGVRIVHKESGAVGESRDERSQLHNKRTAMQRLANSPKFKLWINRKVWELQNKKTIDQIVDESMQEENIKTEVKVDGKWNQIDVKELDNVELK